MSTEVDPWEWGAAIAAMVRHSLVETAGPGTTGHPWLGTPDVLVQSGRTREEVFAEGVSIEDRGADGPTLIVPLRCHEQRTDFICPVRFLLPTRHQPTPDYFLTQILANLDEFIIFGWRGGNGYFKLHFVR